MAEVETATDSRNASTSGWLERRFILGFFSPRFCKLADSTLEIYKDEACQYLDNRLEITSNTTVEYSEDDANCFKITTADGDSVTLKAKNKDMLMQWILALRSCTFTTPELDMKMFRILSVIGRGFYGKVMLCQKISNGEIIAIKSIHKSRLIQSGKVHTVIAEKNILSKATHPFIVSLKFAFQTPSKFYLGLEYAPGGELFFHMQKCNTIPTDDTRIYVAEIALALNHLHSLGVVYRDLKPENILLDAKGHIKLTDFGLAKDILNTDMASTFCGTSEYLAPEIVRREKYGIEVDWWALGILTYEMLFGKTPFANPNKARMFQNILEKEPQFAATVPKDIVEFISACLTKDRKRRISFKRLKTMRFFDGLSFDAVLAKQVVPSFIPKVEKISIPSNFDSEFTSEQANDSYVLPVYGSEERFPGFSYVESDPIGTPAEVAPAQANVECEEDSPPPEFTPEQPPLEPLEPYDDEPSGEIEIEEPFY